MMAQHLVVKWLKLFTLDLGNNDVVTLTSDYQVIELVVVSCRWQLKCFYFEKVSQI